MGEAALPILAISTVAGLSESRKASKQQRRANRVQQRAAAIQNARQRRQGRAQAIRSAATLEAQGVASGTSGSSTVAGRQASLQTQLSSNLSFQGQLESLDRAKFSALNAASKAQSNAATFSAIANFAAMNRTVKVSDVGSTASRGASPLSSPVTGRAGTPGGFTNPVGMGSSINMSGIPTASRPFTPPSTPGFSSFLTGAR